jgi:Domain of unknown function (DUF4342)
MAGKQVKGPLQLLGELIIKENTRTLVIHGKDRTIARLPLGFAIVIGIVLLLMAPPVLVIVGLLALYSDGGSIAVEGPAHTTPLAPHA